MPETAQRDENNITTLIGALETDGETIVPIQAEVTGFLLVDDSTTGTDHGGTVAPRDANYVPVLIAVSSVDGVTPVVIYADATGKLLVESN